MKMNATIANSLNSM